MNYQRIYDELIARAVTRGTVAGYSERHHIVPRCLGGSDERGNLVDLTAREHLIAHLLLARANPSHYGLNSAAMMMATTREGMEINSRVYAALRERFAELSRTSMKAYYEDPANRAATGAIAKAAWANPDSKLGSDEWRANHLAVMQSEEYRSSLRAAHKAYWADPANRAAKSASMQRPEVKAAVSAGVKAHFADPANRAALSAVLQRPDVKAAKSAAQKAAWNNPDSKLGTEQHRETMSAATKAAWQNPDSKLGSEEHRALQSAGIKAAWANPDSYVNSEEYRSKRRAIFNAEEYRASVSARSKKFYEDPAQRAASRAATIARHDARHAAAGTTRPVIKPPVKPGTSKARIWAICDELTAELGETPLRHLVVERAVLIGLNRTHSECEYNNWSLYQRQQTAANQEQREAA